MGAVHDQTVDDQFNGHPTVRKTRSTLRRKSEWEGAIVESLIRIGNRNGSLPRGSYWLVTRNHGGLHLTSLPRRCCGFRLHVINVKEHDVTYIGHLAGHDGDSKHVHLARTVTDKWRINGAGPGNTDADSGASGTAGPRDDPA